MRKNIKKETRFLCAQCSVPLHPEGCYTISHAETLLKVCSKFQVFISYSFHVIIFFTQIMKEEAVDPLNARHFNAPGYLNSWQRMC